MSDIEAPNFAAGGLAQFLDEPTVRFLILPADPEAIIVEVSDETWKLWSDDREGPIPGNRPNWGPARVTSEGIVRRETSRNEEAWARYFALLRNGGVDLGLGSDATWDDGSTRRFHLTAVMSRIWNAVDNYGQVVEQLKISGPYELTLALKNLRQTTLSGFGNEWSRGFFGDPNEARFDAVMHRREEEEWPKGDAARELAFALGDWIVNVWGVRQRRWMCRQSDSEDWQFDTRYLRW